MLVAGDDNIPDTADFVIVGGGTAGCVLASRLCTELPEARIVLLGRDHPRSQAEKFTVASPLLSAQVYNNDLPEDVDVNKYFPTQPSPKLDDQETNQPGSTLELIDAATLGGASNIAFQWTYPLDGTVDEWGINGLTSSKANDIFERVARVIDPAQPPPELRHDYAEEALGAFSKFNYSIKDKQVPGEGGFTAELNFLTVDEDGRRRSSYVQYLLPVLNFICKDSLTVIQDVTVIKLWTSLGADKSKKIDTVQHVSSSNPDLLHPQTVVAHEEILLSAGPHGIPKLLLLSGIGPRDSLENKNISPILADVPVGQHTPLRLLVRGAVGRYSGRPLANVANTSLFTNKAARKFRAGDGGIFGVVPAATIGKRNKDGYHTSGWASLEFQDEPCFTVHCFLNPVGYGNFTIANSGDPFADAIVDGALLSDPKDYESALRCVEDSREIIQGGCPEDFGMVDTSLNSSISLQDWVHASTGTSWHFVGGSAVGSVVDGDFKLIGGLKGVRVIDASIIPKLTVSSGPLSSACMIAEFASDKLVEECSSKFGPVNTAESFMLVLSVILIFAALTFSS